MKRSRDPSPINEGCGLFHHKPHGAFSYPISTAHLPSATHMYTCVCRVQHSAQAESCHSYLNLLGRRVVVSINYSHGFSPSRSGDTVVFSLDSASYLKWAQANFQGSLKSTLNDELESHDWRGSGKISKKCFPVIPCFYLYFQTAVVRISGPPGLNANSSHILLMATVTMRAICTACGIYQRLIIQVTACVWRSRNLT